MGVPGIFWQFSGTHLPKRGYTLPRLYRNIKHMSVQQTLAESRKYPSVAAVGYVGRSAAAEFLGVSASQISVDCGYLGYHPRSPLSVSDLFGIYAIRQWQLHLESQGRDRRIIASRIQSGRSRDSMLRQLEAKGVGVFHYLESLETWLCGGAGLSLAMPEPSGLARYKRIRQYRKAAPTELFTATERRISRRQAAEAIGVSHPTIGRYLHAMRDLGVPVSDRKSLGLDEFRAVWAIGKAIALCRQKFRVYRSLSIEAFVQAFQSPGQISLPKTAFEQALQSREADMIFNGLISKSA
jgi:hypothetical protein